MYGFDFYDLCLALYEPLRFQRLTLNTDSQDHRIKLIFGIDTMMTSLYYVSKGLVLKTFRTRQNAMLHVLPDTN